MATSTDEQPTSTSTSTSTSTTPKIIASLDELPPLPQYRAVLLDQFGVLHDGQRPYAGSVEATRQLAVGQKRKIVLLSNSSRRATHALDRLDKMGFEREWFHGAVTSGEVAHRLLEARAARAREREGGGAPVSSSSSCSIVDDERGEPLDVGALGSRCFHITWGARGAVSVEGLGLELVDDPRDADFILAHGTEAIGTAGSEEGGENGSGSGSGGSGNTRPVSLREIRETLERAANEKGSSLPLLCANPDLVTVDGAELRTMPGTLARWYGDAGGRVVLLGKPGPAIYSAAAALLLSSEGGGGGQGESGEKENSEFRLLAIGDSLEHDIAGAAGAPPSVGGVDSVFIGGGIHAKELGVAAVDGGGRAGKDNDLDASALEELLRGKPREQRPTFAMAWYRA